MANLGQNHPNFHAKSNLPGYLYVMNYNFVNTEPIFKIRNSAESYCLAELQYSSPNSLILPLFFPSPPLAQNLILFTSVCKEKILKYQFNASSLTFVKIYFHFVTDVILFKYVNY